MAKNTCQYLHRASVSASITRLYIVHKTYHDNGDGEQDPIAFDNVRQSFVHNRSKRILLTTEPDPVGWSVQPLVKPL